MNETAAEYKHYKTFLPVRLQSLSRGTMSYFGLLKKLIIKLSSEKTNPKIIANMFIYCFYKHRHEQR